MQHGLLDLLDQDEIIVARLTTEDLEGLKEVAVTYEAGLLVPAGDEEDTAVPLPAFLILTLICLALIVALVFL